MKRLTKASIIPLVCLAALCFAHAASAQDMPPRPTAPVPVEPNAIPLRPPVAGALPAQREADGPAGPAVRNVVDPTLTPFLPKAGTGTGVAVIVAPGGGFRLLSIESEGTAVARWLADKGIAACVLQYRTVPGPRDRDEFNRSLRPSGAKRPEESKPMEATPEVFADAQGAIQMVRVNAAKWQIDPTRVGIVGFSAGAMTALSVGLGPKDTRPDFIASIYGPMGPRPVPADAPPMFTAIALDDPLFAQGKTLDLIQAWRNAGRPVEAHLYERGSHGFGMNSDFAGSALWIDQFYAWMKDRGLLPPAK